MGRKIDVDKLVSAQDIADELGISRQAVHQLHKRRSHNLFPEPVRALSIGFVWNWPDVEGRARKTGRYPPKDDDR